MAGTDWIDHVFESSGAVTFLHVLLSTAMGLSPPAMHMSKSKKRYCPPVHVAADSHAHAPHARVSVALL